MMMVSKGLVLLLCIVAAVCELGNCTEYTAVYDADGRRQCAVGHQPDEVRPSTNTMTFECARLCDDNPECIVFNLYDNTTCEIFTCSSKSSLDYQVVESCKSFRINDCSLRCTESQTECDIKATTPRPTQPPPFRDCEDVRAAGHTESGVYLIKVGNSDDDTSVYCDMSNSGSWLVFQRRKEGSVDFNRTWTEYANGFGDLNGEFWLGNEILYNLLANRSYTLRIDMEDWDGNTAYAEYSNFSIASASDNYTLSVGGYNGSAGDSFRFENGEQFSTWDQWDTQMYWRNVAQQLGAGWWYNSYLGLPHAQLNGVYRPMLNGGNSTHFLGIYWYTFMNSFYSLYRTEMKIGQ